MRWIHFENPDDVYGWESPEEFATGGQIQGEWFGLEGKRASAPYFAEPETRVLMYAMAAYNWRENPDVHEGTFTMHQIEDLQKTVEELLELRGGEKQPAKGFK